MTPDLHGHLARVHGALAWIAAVALVALAVALARLPVDTRLPRRLRLASAATTSLVTAAFATGAWLDLPYRVHLRQRLFLASRALGWLFERKLHLSFGAFLFAALALVALLAAGVDAPHEPARALRRASRLGYVVSALFALVACVIGALVRAKLRASPG